MSPKIKKKINSMTCAVLYQQKKNIKQNKIKKKTKKKTARLVFIYNQQKKIFEGFCLRTKKKKRNV